LLLTTVIMDMVVFGLGEFGEVGLV
jgi:hypothetical protein